MKLSLDVIGYGGYFTKDHEKLSLEDSVKRAAKFGYDAACIFAHRPLGFPGDLDADRRKKLVDLYKELGLDMGAVVCCNNFMDGNHVLTFPQEKEILYTKAAIDLAADVGSPIVRVMAALIGYFRLPRALDGYGMPSYEDRNKRVSRNEDYLEAWHDVRRGLTEVSKYAEDKGIILALQTHPEITGNNDITMEMIEEVNVPSLKIGLDLPLLESTDPVFVKNIIHKMKDYMVYSHTISMAKECTIGGAPYSWEEVCPGSEKDPLPWDTFVESLAEINYKGLLSHEQCSPIHVKGHQLGGVDVIDERYIEARNYFRPLLEKYNAYDGKAPLEI